jgi:uncharacterized membrane protein YhiD involved in acid resistance
MDLVYLFWAISTGIICGAGLAQIAVILALVITLCIFVLSKIPVAKSPLILVVNTSALDTEKEIMDAVKKDCRSFKIKSRNLSKEHLDMVIEVRPKNESELVKTIAKMEFVTNVSLLMHDGEVTF